MPDLVKQPTSMPTRKMLAVIITGMIMGGAKAFILAVWPDSPLLAYIDTVDASVLYWVDYILTVGAMITAGWFTKERAV